MPYAYSRQPSRRLILYSTIRSTLNACPTCGNARYSLSFEVTQIPAGLDTSVLKVGLLIIRFAGRLKPQPYIVQQGRLIFFRREVVVRIAPDQIFDKRPLCMQRIGATVLISFVRFCSSLPFTGSVPTFFGCNSVCCSVRPHSSRVPAVLHCPQPRRASSCRPLRCFRQHCRSVPPARR